MGAEDHEILAAAAVWLGTFALILGGDGFTIAFCLGHGGAKVLIADRDLAGAQRVVLDAFGEVEQSLVTEVYLRRQESEIARAVDDALTAAGHRVAGIETEETDRDLEEWGAMQYLEEIPAGIPEIGRAHV